MFIQCPFEVQDRLFYGFLFTEFMHDYWKNFRFEKQSFHKRKYCFYSWEDQYYRSFMATLLKNLEPRKEESDVVLFQELDDVSEILFISKGQVDMGFEINRKRYFVFRQKNKLVIGEHECSFNQKSMYIYKTNTVCLGHSIRKLHWLRILTDFPEIASQLKKRVSKTYFFQQVKINLKKKQEIMRIKQRSDIDQIMTVASKQNDKDQRKKDALFIKEMVNDTEL